jgi:hypothetical protein
MSSTNDVLWRINNEYRKRLSQAQTFLDLLEQVMLANSGYGPPHTLEALHYARQQVAELMEEHRQWRHSYYYDSLETRRMVHEDRAINKALSRFSRMRTQHEQRAYDAYALLFQSPRPDPRVTRVPNGDLWTMTQYALNDLIVFGDYISNLGVLN